MYVDMSLAKDNGFQAIIYLENKAFPVKSKDINRLVYYVGQFIKNYCEKEVYIDTKGYGIALTDYLDKQGVKYKVLDCIHLTDLDKLMESY